MCRKKKNISVPTCDTCSPILAFQSGNRHHSSSVVNITSKMASKVNFFRSAVSKSANILVPRPLIANQTRTAVTTETGAILKRPTRIRHPLFKTSVTVGFGITVGGIVSSWLANFLEEYDIFVPDNDDD